MPSRRSLTFPRTLWAKLVGFAGASLTLILVGAVSLSILETKARIQHSVDAEATATADGVANAVAGKLNEAGATAKTMAGIIGTLHDLHPHDRATAIAVLRTNCIGYDDVFGAWIQETPNGGFDGATLENAPGSNGLGIFTPYWTKTGTGVQLITFKALYEEQYYRLPASTGRPAITEPYVYKPYANSGNVLMVSIGDPIFSNGRLIGVTGVDIGLDRLARTLAALKPFGQGRVMLVSASGDWLVNPDPRMILQPYTGEGRTDLAAALADGRPRLLHNIMHGTAERIIYPFGVPDLAATWAIIIDVPETVINAPVRHETNIIITAGAIIILITLTGLYIITKLIIQRPMAALLGAVERLRRGDYGTTITGQTRRDETATLARALDGFRLRLAEGQILEAQNAVLLEMSATDGLTGAANRRAFDVHLALELERVKTIGAGLALIMIDVDYFKSYNDFHGHPLGDARLRELVTLIRSKLRDSYDLLARYGGEEFAIIMSDIGYEQAVLAAERVCLAVAQAQAPHGGPGAGPFVTISVGVSVVTPDHNIAPPALIQQADQALYRAKKSGRNKVKFAVA